MRILALDIGARRIGLASGDTLLGIAFARSILTVADFSSTEGLLQEIANWVRREKIEKIFLGYARHESAEDNEQLSRSREFADVLEDFLLAHKISTPVDFVYEGFSTQIAAANLRSMNQGTREQAGQKDALAAAAFLQNYFDQHEK